MGTSTQNSSVKANRCTIKIFLCVINNGELRVTAINELDFFSTGKGVKRNVPLKMRSVLLMVMHSFVPCCRTAQPLVFDSFAFRDWFCPLSFSSSFSPYLKRLIPPASAPGGGD